MFPSYAPQHEGNTGRFFDCPMSKPRRRFNWRVSDAVRRAMKSYLEWSARLRGQRFYCRALAGDSEYNITVNCDLTVACNCQDYNGAGALGDLSKNSFAEVFFSPKAQHLREELAKGKIPIMTCTRCSDLRRVRKAEVRQVSASEYFQRFRETAAAGLQRATSPDAPPPFAKAGAAGTLLLSGPPPRLPHRGLLLENTVRCNIDCIGCDRGSAALIRRTKQMELDKLARMADLVAEMGLQELYYLNLGEPFLSPNIGQEMPLLRQKNPNCRIVISTNGIILNNDVKREAAMYASNILFSIAGISEEMLKKYEHYGSFEKAYANIKALVQYRNARGLTRPVIEWKYLLFNWNDSRAATDRAIEMARAAGVDIISFWPTCNPFFGMSWRYRFGLLNHIGVSSWKGRELDLRNSAERTPAVPKPSPAAALS
jgi:hypothetical protein